MPYKDPERQRAYQRDWTRQRRAELLNGAVCMRCGGTERLELHHLVPDEKTTHRITTWRPDRRDAERALCVVLCADCHTAYHAAQRRHGHGTVAEYDKRGCRCDQCRAAKAEYRARKKGAVNPRKYPLGDLLPSGIPEGIPA